MPKINTLHKSITELPRSEVFDLITAIRLRRIAPPKNPVKKKKTATRRPKTTDPLTLFKSMSAADKQALKNALMEKIKK